MIGGCSLFLQVMKERGGDGKDVEVCRVGESKEVFLLLFAV